MMFKNAYPKPSRGCVLKNKNGKLTVPNQSMSLSEILERFTRGESIPVMKQTQYHESEDDLEKVGQMDIVDRLEFADKQKQIQKKYAKQERAKKKKIEDEEREKIAQKIAAENLEKLKTSETQK